MLQGVKEFFFIHCSLKFSKNFDPNVSWLMVWLWLGGI